MTSYFSTSRIGTYTLRYTDEWRYDREMLNGHLYGYIVNTTNTHTMSKHSNIETLTATSRDRDAPARTLLEQRKEGGDDWTPTDKRER